MSEKSKVTTPSEAAMKVAEKIEANEWVSIPCHHTATRAEFVRSVAAIIDTEIAAAKVDDIDILVGERPTPAKDPNDVLDELFPKVATGDGELLPCPFPFCGSDKAQIISSLNSEGKTCYDISCLACGCQSHTGFYVKADLYKALNDTPYGRGVEDAAKVVECFGERGFTEDIANEIRALLTNNTRTVSPATVEKCNLCGHSDARSESGFCLAYVPTDSRDNTCRCKCVFPAATAGGNVTAEWEWHDRWLRASGYTDLANRMKREFRPDSLAYVESGGSLPDAIAEPYCEPCRSFHPVPRDAAHKAELKCFAITEPHPFNPTRDPLGSGLCVECGKPELPAHEWPDAIAEEQLSHDHRSELANCPECQRLGRIVEDDEIAEEGDTPDCCDAAMRERLAVDAVSLNREQCVTIQRLRDELAAAKRDLVAKVKQRAEENLQGAGWTLYDVASELEKES